MFRTVTFCSHVNVPSCLLQVDEKDFFKLLNRAEFAEGSNAQLRQQAEEVQAALTALQRDKAGAQQSAQLLSHRNEERIKVSLYPCSRCCFN